MKTVNRYITVQLVSTFIATLAVLTFIMLAAGMVSGVELLAKGINFGLFAEFVGYRMPKALGLAIPMSLLTSTILLFSRLSADNEITAMRAGGISIWQIITPCLAFSAILSGLCFWLQSEIIPVTNQMSNNIKYNSQAINPRILIEPGRSIEIFDGYIIYLDEIISIDKNTDELKGVRLYQIDAAGKVVKDFIAVNGKLEHLVADQQFNITLYNANSSLVGEHRTDRVKGTAFFPLKYGEQLSSGNVYRKVKHIASRDISARVQLNMENNIPTMPLYVEMHKRMALALSPFAFMLLGIPFGIRTNRNETSVGLVNSLVLAMGFYVFIIIAENLENNPALHPDFLIWIPNIVYQLGGLWAIKKIGSR